MRIKKTSQYIEDGANLSNVYGTSNENGYTQEYINGLPGSEVNAITVRLNEIKNITASSAYGLNLIQLNDEFIKLGNKLTFNSTNNSIVIGAGVHHVEVSANANIRNSTTSLSAERIIVSVLTSNGTDTKMASTQQAGILSSSSNTSNITLSISPFIYSVSENDEIKLEYASEISETINVYGSNYFNATYLTVKVID